jgi:outer membrane protein OmpA-like peptidoglycan-associated protein
MTATKRNLALGLTLVCVPILTIGTCDSAIADSHFDPKKGYKVESPEGYIGDAKTIRAKGGVGNYLFRYIKDHGHGKEEKRTAARDSREYETIRSSQSSGVIRSESKARDKLFFDHQSSSLSSAEKRKLRPIAEELKRDPTREIEIKGYADSTGSDAFNSALSQQRAQAVVEELRNQGVSSAQLRWKGLGTEDPIGDNSTSRGRAQNRRVEILE